LEWKATLAKAHPSGLAPEFLLSLVERSSPRGLRPRLFLLHRRFLLAKLGEEELRAQFGSLPLQFLGASLVLPQALPLILSVAGSANHELPGMAVGSDLLSVWGIARSSWVAGIAASADARIPATVAPAASQLWISRPRATTAAFTACRMARSAVISALTWSST